MQKSILTTAILAVLGTNTALAAVDGGTSNSAGVQVGPANHILFGGGNSGLKLNNSLYGFINIANGPVRGSNEAIDIDGADANGNYFLKPSNVISWLPDTPHIAQVWRDTAAVNGSNAGTAYFAVNSIRQIQTFPEFIPAPVFGGLVIGQVAAPVVENGQVVDIKPLEVGSGVYFGEWAPKANSLPVGTNLNMTSADRTVWYVGDNATTATTMPSTIEAKYGVIGISMTGSDASGNTLAGGLPGNQNYYTGKLDVSYDANRPQTQNIITGTIGRGGYDINFGKAGDATTITNTGSFGNVTGTIDGQFYNAANELAGIYTGTDTPNSVAFGGSKIANNP